MEIKKTKEELLVEINILRGQEIEINRWIKDMSPDQLELQEQPPIHVMGEEP